MGLAIVEGEPGVGKTRLLQEIAAEAERRDAIVVWGSCLEGEGTPSMWPWVQVVGSVVATLPAALQETWLDSDLGRLVEPRESILAGSFSRTAERSSASSSGSSTFSGKPPRSGRWRW